jgi:hypothetical protein
MGFFSLSETRSNSRPDGKLYSCVSCGLYKNGKNPKFKPYGQGKKKIMLIGSAPLPLEDQRGQLSKIDSIYL